MAINVSLVDVCEALRPVLGSSLAEDRVLCENLAAAMEYYQANNMSLEELNQQLTAILFDGLYDHLGENMTLRRDDGTLARIYLKDIPVVADDAMWALFKAMPIYSTTFQSLKDYSMRSSSLSAMRVLYENFDRFQTDEENELMVRIIRERYPAIRYESWLKEKKVASQEGEG